MIIKWIAVILLVSTTPVYAIGVSPTRIMFDSSGNSSQQITITGDKSSPVAVEIDVIPRVKELKETLVENENCLSLSLPQAYLEPSQSLSVFIKHKADDSECQSGSFYVVIETLTIDGISGSNKNQVTFSSRLLIPLHINPGAFNQLKVALENQGKLSITNSGDGAVLYSTFDVQLGAGEDRMIITGQRLAKHFRSDALLSDASVTLDLTEFLQTTDYQNVQVVPASLASDQRR